MPTTPSWQNSRFSESLKTSLAGEDMVDPSLRLREFVWAGIAILSVTGAAWLFQAFIGYQTVALLYLLLVVVSGLTLSPVPVLIMAASSAVMWNFLFVQPRYTFLIERFHDATMFVTFFIVALSMGHLTSRLRRQEIIERHREHRTAALYELTYQAAFATNLDDGLEAAVKLIESIFGAKAALLLRQKDHSLSQSPHASSSFFLSGGEKHIAAWAFEHRVPAGRFTDSMPSAEAIHIPLQGRTAVMGVLSVQLPLGRTPDKSERDLLQAFALLIGLVLEKDHIIEAFKHAEIVEASEQLRRALLQSVSHELKTPLAAVQAGMDALAHHPDTEEKRVAVLGEVQLAVRRLHRVINNLLNMTRIESGVVRPSLDWCDVGDIVQAAVDLAGHNLDEHRIVMDIDESLPMIKLDQPLLEQCLCNLLLNAASNSLPSTKITVRAQLNDGRLTFLVADEGKGVPSEDLPHIFETFYRGRDASAGGTGLGLAIVKGFVLAHGGTVRAANRETGGSEFAITIPVETLPSDIMEKFA